MSQVFLVQHVHERDDGSEDVKVVGVYSSREAAEHAIARLGGLPGFAESREGFHLDAYELDKDHWTTGFVSIE